MVQSYVYKKPLHSHFHSDTQTEARSNQQEQITGEDVALDDIGALMFSHNIGLQNKTYFYREIGLCNLHGDSHALFSYSLPSPVHLTKTDIALMKQKTVNEHGMHYEISNDQLHPFEHLEADLTAWLQSVLTKDKPAMGVCDDGPLKSLLKSLDIPFVDISGFDPKQQCIGTTGVLPSGQGLPLCRDHYYGNNDIGFEDCARVRSDVVVASQTNLLLTLARTSEQARCHLANDATD